MPAMFSRAARRYAAVLSRLGRSAVRAGGVLLAVAATACHAEQPSFTPKTVTPPASSAIVRSPKTPPRWVVSAATLRRHRPLAAKVFGIPEGVVIDGLRISYPDGAVAEDVADPQLIGGSRIPEYLGGGQLFWSSSAVYRTRSLLGRLEPVFASNTNVSSVSFGPKLGLVQFSDGSRRAIELPSARPIPMPLPGLIDLGSAGAKASVALAHPGRVLIATGSGGWKEVATDARIESLIQGDGEVWLEDASGHALRLGEEGVLGRYDRRPQSPLRNTLGEPDPRWPVPAETPLERAVRRGVPLGERWALVEADGAIAKVDLVSGELVEIGRRILPLAGGTSCRLLSLEGELAATCGSDRGPVYFASGLGGSEPRIEKTFQATGVFYYAGTSSVLFSGPCGSAPDEKHSVCIRGADRRWRSVAFASDRDGGPAPPAIVRFIPKRDGSVLGVIAGSTPGLIELPGGKIAPFVDKGHEGVATLSKPTVSEQLVDDAMLTEADGIRLLTPEGSVVVRRDGSIERGPHRMRQLAHASGYALGRDEGGRFWQTSDWGESWLAVAGPPSGVPRPNATPRHCSLIGCDLDSWYRIGYPVESDSPRKYKTAPPAARSGEPSPIRIVCAPAGPASQASLAASESGGDDEDDGLDLGARRLAGPPRDLRRAFGIESQLTRLVIWGEQRETQNEPRVVSVRFVEPLALRPVVRSARPPSTVVLPNLFAQHTGEALPVASGTSTDGWLLPIDAPNGTVVVWMRADRPARFVSLGEPILPSLATVVARGDELLLPVMQQGNCADSVIAVGSRSAQPILQLGPAAGAANCTVPDSIGIGSGAEISLLRYPSGPTPPSSDDPALLLSKAEKPVVLAPWSELRTADAPECAGTLPDEVRAMINASQSWLALTVAGAPIDAEELTMLAQVRWSPKRVCLEAVELGSAPEVEVGDVALPTELVARFGAKNEAARRGIDFGTEYFEPQSCRLARRP